MIGVQYFSYEQLLLLHDYITLRI